jgi:hypothetical protein
MGSVFLKVVSFLDISEYLTNKTMTRQNALGLPTTSARTLPTETVLAGSHIVRTLSVRKRVGCVFCPGSVSLQVMNPPQ